MCTQARQGAAMGVWKLAIEIALPIPLVFIVALLLPAPRQAAGPAS